MSVSTTLFPPANRQAAAVAFLRTFWQTVRATGYLASGGIITITATQLATIDVRTLALTAAAILTSGLLSGTLAAGNILTNGLPTAYQNTTTPAAAAIPAATANPAPTQAGTPPTTT